ncbi:MAG: DUF4147 domain-containing protein [Patescibacteria group bacterium]
MKIKNSESLGTSELRRAALAIAEAGLDAIDTKKVIRNTVSISSEHLAISGESIALSSISNIIVCAVGKCAADGAEALEEILGDRISGGVVIDAKPLKKFARLTGYTGTHPLPSRENAKATKHLIDILEGAKEDDLVIMLISGGGSTLLSSPQDIEPEDEAEIFKLLTKQGATIQELNTARKHLSFARGGYLAKHAYPAKVVSLIFSDVPGNDLQFIASGPTVKDRTTIPEAMEIIEKYIPRGEGRGYVRGLIETPKEDKYFKRVKNIILVSGDVALNAMAEKAKEAGFRPEICATCLTGEARMVGANIINHLHGAASRTAHLYGGEMTVTIRGSGKGGRNMECALAGLSVIRDGELLLPFASDGKDSAEFAGGVCDIITREHAIQAGIDAQSFLANNDSFHFFEATGDNLLTGPTESNVSDLLIAIKI